MNNQPKTGLDWGRARTRISIVGSFLLTLCLVQLICAFSGCQSDDRDGIEHAAKPGIPGVFSPVDGAFIPPGETILTVTNASDLLERALLYDFEVYTDPDLIYKITEGRDILQGTSYDSAEQADDTTSWLVQPALPAGRTYWWRARANTEQTAGEWMSAAQFSIMDQLTPSLIFPIAEKVCPDNVSLIIANIWGAPLIEFAYDFEVYEDCELTVKLLEISNVPQQDGGYTSAIVPHRLPDQMQLYWRARVVWQGQSGPWSKADSFDVEAIARLTLVSPGHGSTTLFQTPELVVQTSDNPCLFDLVYDFEVFTGPDLLDKVTASFNLMEGDYELTSWTVAVPLTDQTTYWWRSRARSREYVGPWSLAQSFTVDTGKPLGNDFADAVVWCGVTCPDAVIYRDCTEAIGPPDYWSEDNPDNFDGRTYHGFVSLGIRGSLIVDMGEGTEIVDGPDADFKVWQAVATEQFQIYVAEHAGGPYVDLGISGSGWYESSFPLPWLEFLSYPVTWGQDAPCYTTSYDRGGEIAVCDVAASGLEKIRFVRIVDQQPWGDLRRDCFLFDLESGEWHAYLHAGADIDAIRALQSKPR